MENIQEPSDHIAAVLERVKPEYISKTYQIESWSDPTDFMEQAAKRMGRLLKASLVHSSIRHVIAMFSTLVGWRARHQCRCKDGIERFSKRKTALLCETSTHCEFLTEI